MKNDSLSILIAPHLFQRLLRSIRSKAIEPSRVRLIIGYGAIGVLVAILAAVLLAPLMSTMISDWSRRDVESRSRLVFNTIQDPLVAMLAAGEVTRIEALFESVAADSRVVAVAFCKADDERAISSKLMPSSLPCDAIARGSTETFSSLQANGRDMLIASFPLSTREIDGHFVIVHDLTFSERRGNEARNFVSILLGSIVLLSGATAVALVLFLTRSWIRSFRRALFNVTRNAEGSELAGSGGVLDRELQLIIRQLKAGTKKRSAPSWRPSFPVSKFSSLQTGSPTSTTLATMA
jgi:trehalose 6-phosphate synthase